MRNVKCSYCEEYRNEWCEKIIDSPHPDILRDCQYFHEAKTRWIPCGVRLPEEEGEYLITDDSGGIKTIEVDSFMFFEDGTKDWCYSQNAIAWMPLPDPYEGGEQDEND